MKEKVRKILKLLVLYAQFPNVKEKEKELNEKFNCTFNFMTIDKATDEIMALIQEAQ